MNFFRKQKNKKISKPTEKKSTISYSTPNANKKTQQQKNITKLQDTMLVVSFVHPYLFMLVLLDLLNLEVKITLNTLKRNLSSLRKIGFLTYSQDKVSLTKEGEKYVTSKLITKLPFHEKITLKPQADSFNICSNLARMELFFIKEEESLNCLHEGSFSSFHYYEKQRVTQLESSHQENLIADALLLTIHSDIPKLNIIIFIDDYDYKHTSIRKIFDKSIKFKISQFADFQLQQSDKERLQKLFDVTSIASYKILGVVTNKKRMPKFQDAKNDMVEIITIEDLLTKDFWDQSYIEEDVYDQIF